MKMSSAVEWCFHAAVLIEQAPPGSLVTRQQIADFHGVSESYLAKHLKSLVSQGILDAITGPNGGYRLAKPADTITGLDIVQAVEGTSPAFSCTEIRQQGTGAASPAECKHACSVNALMQSSESAWRQRLAETSIADLVSTIPQSVRERNRRNLGRSRDRGE